jgi:tRNA(adenine34) deaminase
MAVIEYDDEFFMRQALQEAHLALDEKEIPIGCVVVCKDKIIGKGHNMTERLNDSTSHAEMIAISASEEFLGGKYLKDCTLYVTIEPCLMCCGAMYWTQIKRVVYGARDMKKGCLLKGNFFHEKTVVEGGVLEKECRELIQEFFKTKRGR